jgi:predicted acylesterase/phospholipase RssA
VQHHCPMKKCDLVMKGGITSGIVYPGAVLELSKEFRFANIGGTSAGAIAAALTAAAEHRRAGGGGSAGFDAIAKLPSWMAERVGGRSRLLRLFEPPPETEALFEAALAYVETSGAPRTKAVALFRMLMRGFPRFGSIAAAAGVTLMVLAAWSAAHAAILIVIAALALLTGAAIVAATVVEALLHAARVLPRQGFGLSTGKALTEWLTEEIDRVAGTETPLTFGDLRARDVNLEVMTTNLTHGRPYRMPLESRHFFFDAAEMRGLFPERVVQWMIEHAEARGSLYSLPAEAMPVVVATRMSLSFPLLLSAVPLWAVDFGRRTGKRRPERCWFSDGGITSNFPVHFFDAPVPRWPTFAINLAEHVDRYHAPEQRVYVPRSNRGGILEWWTSIEDLSGFVKAIAGTMQNWRDNMLLHLPGQRDRIAHVLLAPGEGGMNLSMDEGTIAGLAARGEEAGRAFREQFRWRNHKWLRFLSFMSSLEGALESWERAFDDVTEPPSVRELVSGPDPLPSYKVSPVERAAMSEASVAFLEHVRASFASQPFRKPKKRPRPEAVLRAMPRE